MSGFYPYTDPAATGGTDVTVENPAGVVYIYGDATTDGSLRIVPDPDDSTAVLIQVRISGQWLSGGMVAAYDNIMTLQDSSIVVDSNGNVLTTGWYS